MTYNKSQRDRAALVVQIATQDFQMRLEAMKASGATMAEILNATVDPADISAVEKRLNDLFGAP